MSRFLRWSRCAFAISLAIQACPSTSFAQGRAVVGTNSPSSMPVRPAQMAAPADPQAFSERQASAIPSSDATDGSYMVSDGGGDCSGGSCDGCYSGVCPSDNGCYSACNNCCQCGPRCCFFADYLYLQVTDADVTHAQQQNGIGGAGTVPFGDIGTIDTKFDSGIRLGGSICCGPCSSVLMSYSFFETENTDTLDEPFIPGGGGAVGSLVHHPGAAITASTGPVSAGYDVQFQVADALFRHECWGNSCYTVNFLVGAQYGHLEQDFRQSGVFSGGNAGAIKTSTDIDFDGGGLKAGFDMNRQLSSCISLYGRFTAAAMQGQFHGRYTMVNESTTQVLADADWSDNRVVPQLEYEAGFALTKNRWRLSAGYMMSQWLNSVTTPEFIHGVQDDSYVNISDRITFAGLVARVGCCW